MSRRGEILNQQKHNRTQLENFFWGFLWNANKRNRAMIGFKHNDSKHFSLGISMLCIERFDIAVFRTVMALILVGFGGSASAALLERGNQLVYDTDLNVTWLADFNYFGTQAVSNPNLVSEIIAAVPMVSGTPGGYDSPAFSGQYKLTTDDFFIRNNGDSSLMSWWGTQAWVSQLVYQGYSDWRIAGNFLDGTLRNEVSHLYFNDLGFTPGVPSAGNAVEMAKFTNSSLAIDTFIPFWLGSYDDSIGQNGLMSTLPWGSIGSSTKTNKGFALAVRDGDVAFVPEPAAVWLIAISLGLLSFTRKKLQNS